MAQANGPPQGAAPAEEHAAAADGDGDAMDLDEEDPGQMTIVRNYQRQDPRCVLCARSTCMPCSGSGWHSVAAHPATVSMPLKHAECALSMANGWCVARSAAAVSLPALSLPDRIQH